MTTTTPLRHRRVAALARGLAALAALAALLAGVPTALLYLGGNPLPDHIPSIDDITTALGRPDNGQLFLATLAWAGWAGWAVLVATVLIEIPAQLRGHPTPHLPGLGWAQHTASLLITTIAVTLTGPTPTTATPPQPIAAAATTPATTPATPAPLAPPDTQTATPQANQPLPTPTRIYQVRPGDSLWRIAERELGDPTRHTEITHLNTGRTMSDGHPFNPDAFLRPGWKLHLPTNPNPANPPTSHTPTPPADPDQHTTHHVQPGDTLWDIAARKLGDPTRHTDIYQLNKNQPQPDGHTLTNPDLIRPGWRLLLPVPESASPDPDRADSPRQRDSSTRPAPPGTGPAGAPPAVGVPEPGQGGRGSADPAPSTSPATSPASPTVSPPAGSLAAESDTEPDGEKSGDPGPAVRLPSGAVVGFSLATAVSAALVMARLHRRRRRVTPPRDMPIDGSDPPLPPPVVRVLRRAHLRAHLPPDDDPHDPGWPVGLDESPLALRGAGLPAPGYVTLGARGGEEVSFDLARLGGIALAGPGAYGVTRSVLAGLLAHHTEHRVELILPTPDAARLLDRPAENLPSDLAGIPGLVLAASVEEGLTRLEVEIVGRTRILETLDTPDAATARAADPAEPLPTTLLVATPPPGSEHRLATLLTLGGRLDITGVLLGPGPTGLTCEADTSGNLVQATGPAAAAAHGIRLFHLTAPDLADLLALAAEAHGHHPATTSPQATGPPPASAPTSTGPQDRTVAGPDPTDTELHLEVPEPPSQTAEPSPTPAEEGTRPPAAGGRPFTIRVLGPLRLDAAGRDITDQLRPKARSLLAYLSTRRDGASLEATTEALWPGVPPERAADRFHATLAQTRKILRQACQAPGQRFITRDAGHYRLDPTVTSVDLWDLQDTLATHGASGQHAGREALAETLTLYRGDLLPDQFDDWVEPLREAVRRQALDGLTQLADAYENDNPERALRFLEQALTHDPHGEELYRRVMTLQARLGRTDAVARTKRLLDTRLAELDLEPDDNTERLTTALLHPPPPTQPGRDAPQPPYRHTQPGGQPFSPSLSPKSHP